MKLLKFYSDTCMPCKVQSKILSSNKIDIDIQEINIEDNFDQAEHYNVRNLPTIILIDDNNNELHRFVGITNIDEINKIIKEFK